MDEFKNIGIKFFLYLQHHNEMLASMQTAIIINSIGPETDHGAVTW